MSRTALRICPLCEATCGLVLTVDDGKVTGARGDRDDVFSKGFICPKGAAFGEVDSDPDRLRTPRSSASTANCARPPGRRRSTPSPPDCGRWSSGTDRMPSASSSATPTSTPWPAPSIRPC